MEKQTEATPDGRKQGIGWRTWLFLLGVVIVLYGLSFGPVARLEAQGHFKHHRRTIQLVSLVYAPIVWTHHNTPLRGPIEAYVSLWLPAQNK